MLPFVLLFTVLPVACFAAGCLVGAHNASHVAKGLADAQGRLAALEATVARAKAAADAVVKKV